MDTVISKYNSPSDPFFFHHSVSEDGGIPIERHRETHDQFEVVYLIDGEVRYHIEGEEYVAKAGDVIFVPPNEVHTLHCQSGRRYERIVVLFDLRMLKAALPQKEGVLENSFFVHRAKHRVIPRETVWNTKIADTMYAITSTCEQEKYLPIRTLSLVCSLIIELDKVFERQKEGEIAPISADPIVKRAIEFINANVEKQLKLDDIAAHLYVSKSTLCHKFSRQMHVSINRYMTIKKMYHAAGLIKNGMSAVEASAAVGYDYYTTFFHNYKQIIGVSPAQTKQDTV